MSKSFCCGSKRVIGQSLFSITVPMDERLDELATVELIVAVGVVHFEVVELKLLLGHIRRVDRDVHVLLHVPVGRNCNYSDVQFAKFPLVTGKLVCFFLIITDEFDSVNACQGRTLGLLINSGCYSRYANIFLWLIKSQFVRSIPLHFMHNPRKKFVVNLAPCLNSVR